MTDDGNDDPRDTAWWHTARTAADYDDGKEFDVAAWIEEAEEEIEREREAFEEAMKLDTTGVYQDATGNDGDD